MKKKGRKCPMKLSEVDINKVSPMMRHYIELKQEYKDEVLFYRLGDFYEMFFEDAEEVSHTLELTLTGRNAGLDERVPMCGIPYHAKDIYIDRLVKLGYKIAICEQVEDPKSAKGIVKREVTEVISRGTITDSSSLNEKENNYIGSIITTDNNYILTYSDITTGELYTKTILKDSEKLLSEVQFLDLEEIILDTKVESAVKANLKEVQKLTVTVLDNIYEKEDYNYLFQNIEKKEIITSIKHLLYYLVVVGKRNLAHLRLPKIIEASSTLKMDIHTKRNLELTENLRLKEKTYSLLWLLDNTKTAMGSRMLKKYIETPLVDINKINERYNVVSTLMTQFLISEELREYLYKVYDLERLSGKIALETANGKDLIQLRNSLSILPQINSLLKELNYQTLPNLEELYNLLNTSIYEEPPTTIKEGYLIKEGYNKELDELKSLRNGGKNFIASFETSEREKTGIKNLKVGYNKVFGYYIEVSKANTSLVKEEYGYVRKQTLANCERYINNTLKEKEALVLSAEEKIITLEYELFTKIRKQCASYIQSLQEASQIISEIDVLQSFAKVSEKYKYVRPTLTKDHIINIKSSRHPVVEQVIKDQYVDNDILMDKDTNIILITGPNMAGKSTYMRQLGIIVIMAQIGCFIPAKEATLPIFDQIFTRIGASDDLVSGQSTFMVEMLESANAITNATQNSLILFDELGRGTATFDGMSLAQSILEYISKKVRCKTMFSTHYHELTDLEENLTNLKNYHVSCIEKDGNLTFLHKVKKGCVDKSYGINVARLAGLPSEVIERANEILKIYEAKEEGRDVIIQTTLPLDFKEEKNNIEEKIKTLNILDMTPMQALNILYELREEVIQK